MLCSLSEFIFHHTVVFLEVLFVCLSVLQLHGIGIRIDVIVTTFIDACKQVSSCISGYEDTPRVKQESVSAVVVLDKCFVYLIGCQVRNVPITVVRKFVTQRIRHTHAITAIQHFLTV